MPDSPDHASNSSPVDPSAGPDDADDRSATQPIAFRPDLVADDAFVAANVTLRGEVHVGSGASVWFGSVARGDTEPVTIGERSNVQDLCVLHADPGFPCVIGRDATIGHAAVIHGARIDDGALVGIRAVVLNGAHVGAGAIVGAGAVVTEGAVIPPGTLAVGVPAKVMRELTPAEQARVRGGADHYVKTGRRYATQDQLQDKIDGDC